MILVVNEVKMEKSAIRRYEDERRAIIRYYCGRTVDWGQIVGEGHYIGSVKGSA